MSRSENWHVQKEKHEKMLMNLSTERKHGCSLYVSHVHQHQHNSIRRESPPNRSRHHEEYQLTFPPMSTRPSLMSPFLLRTQTPTRASPPSPFPFPSHVPSPALSRQPPVPRAPTTTRSSLAPAPALAPTADSSLPSMTPPTAASSASAHANALRCLAGDTISTTGGAQP